MALDLNKILTKDELNLVPSNVISHIENSINEAFNSAVRNIETENSKKFNSLVESLTTKFETKVGNALMETVKENASGMINAKFYNIVKGMVNLLEDAGIPTTEETKKLQQKLKDAGTQLEKAYEEREALKNLYNDNMKTVIIMKETKGMSPKIVDAALEYFKDKDIREVDKDAIINFLDGDYSQLLNSVDDDNNDDFNGDLDIDKVKEVLDEIENDSTTTNNEFKPAIESLGHGLRNQRVKCSANVSKEMLDEAANMTDDALIESDTKETLNSIEKYRGLGFNTFG